MNEPTLRTYDIPGGDAGLLEKARIMVALAQEDTASIELRRHLARALKGVKERNSRAELEALYKYLREKVRFVQDPLPYSELIQRPTVTLDFGLGDCDDYATAASALLGAAGYDADLVFISTRPSKAWSHVYTRAYFPSRTRYKSIAFDPSTPRGLGWEVPARKVTRKLVVPVFGLSGTRSELMPVAGYVSTQEGGKDRVRFSPNGKTPEIRAWEPGPPQYMGRGLKDRNIRFQNVSTFNGERMPDYFADAGRLPTFQNNAPGGDAGIDRRPFPGRASLYAPRIDLPQLMGVTVNAPSRDPRWVGDWIDAEDILGDLGKIKFKAPAVPKVVQKIANKVVIPSIAKQAAAVKTAANRVANEARKAGKDPVGAFKKSANYYGTKVRQSVDSAIKHLKITPLKKVGLMMASLPPPANMVAAYKYAQKHKTEILNELPAYARDAIVKIENSLDSMFSGHTTSIGNMEDVLSMADTSWGHAGFWAHPVYGVGAMSWPELKNKIKKGWDQLPRGKKNTIIAILVAIVIVVIVVSIVSFGAGAAPATAGGGSAAGAGVSATSGTFFSSVGGWSTFSALIPMLMGFFKGSKGVPADIATSPDASTAPPSPEEQAKLDAAEKTGDAEAKAESAKSAAGFVLPAGAAAALLFLL